MRSASILSGYVPIEAGVGGEGAVANAPGANAKTAHLVEKRSVFKDYDPDEPRVPAGNSDGGQWTDGEIRLAQDDTSGIESDAFPPSQGRGHTWMPTAVYEKYNWQDDTRNVFKNWTSGQLADPNVNAWSPEHEAYNEAANEVLQAYLKKNNIPIEATESVTPAQAREIVEDILGSGDPRISVLRKSVLREAMRYFNVYGPGRWWRGGDEE